MGELEGAGGDVDHLREPVLQLYRSTIGSSRCSSSNRCTGWRSAGRSVDIIIAASDVESGGEYARKISLFCHGFLEGTEGNAPLDHPARLWSSASSKIPRSMRILGRSPYSYGCASRSDSVPCRGMSQPVESRATKERSPSFGLRLPGLRPDYWWRRLGWRLGLTCVTPPLRLCA